MRTMDLRTRVAVYCGEKRYGILRKVVVDPEDGHITDLIVEPAAHEATIRVVPVSLVTRVGVNKVHLGLSAAQIDRYPAYVQPSETSVGTNPLDEADALKETRLDKRVPPESPRPPPAASRPPVEDSGSRIRVFAGDASSHPTTAQFAPGTPVLCADGQLAAIEAVVRDPDTHRLSHITLRHRRVTGYRIVPVSSTVPGCDGLILTPETWDNLRAYMPRDDDELYEEIRATLLARVEPAESEGGALEVAVVDGYVTLLGAVSGEAALGELVQLVSEIPGVIGLRADVEVDV